MGYKAGLRWDARRSGLSGALEAQEIKKTGTKCHLLTAPFEECNGDISFGSDERTGSNKLDCYPVTVKCRATVVAYLCKALPRGYRPRLWIFGELYDE